ncbi:MAG: hypothetical protein HC777_00985 [Hyphomonadaceae bacterium]|nr:hypothetical protein [Hyphomonadaceae bacterium]
MTSLFSLTPEEVHKVPTWRAAFAERTAELMAKLAGLAYEPDLTALQRALSAGGFELLGTYDHGVTQGFLARAPDFAVLAFRGSDSYADWRTNLSSRPVPLVTSLGRIYVHSGLRPLMTDWTISSAKTSPPKFPPILAFTSPATHLVQPSRRLLQPH